MSNRPGYWEIVRTLAGWHGRFRAANGKILWSTEVYRRRSTVVRAIELIETSVVEGVEYPRVEETDLRPYA